MRNTQLGTEYKGRHGAADNGRGVTAAVVIVVQTGVLEILIQRGAVTLYGALCTPYPYFTLYNPWIYIRRFPSRPLESDFSRKLSKRQCQRHDVRGNSIAFPCGFLPRPPLRSDPF